MSQKYDKLKTLLKEFFQMDQSDLDFGLYRVMHTKSAELSQIARRWSRPTESRQRQRRKRRFRRRGAAAEPGASSSNRQVFNCVGVTPDSAAALLCLAPSSDRRTTDCSLYPSENRAALASLPPSVRRPRRARPARRRRTPPPRQEAPRARPPGRPRSACESGWARLPGRTCDPPRQATPDEPEPCRARATCPWRSPKRAPGAGILRRAAGRAHLPCPANATRTGGQGQPRRVPACPTSAP